MITTLGNMGHQQTTLLAACLVCQRPDELADATRRALADGADLCEWRLDTLADPWAAVPLLAANPAWQGRLIITARDASESGGVGGFDGPQEQRISLLEAIGLHRPGAIDLELATYESSANIRQKIHLVCDDVGDSTHPPGDGTRRVRNQLILSRHHFDPAGADAIEWLRPLCRYPRAIAKVAVFPRSDDDAATIASRLSHLPAQRRVCILMGPHGLPIRALAKRWGLAIAYCAANQGPPAAPGQITVRDALARYGWARQSARTRLFGVIGDPVGHSLSPAIHNAGFVACGIDAVYLPLHLRKASDLHRLLDTARKHPDLGWRGFSVTIPHKEALLEFGMACRRDDLAKGGLSTVDIDPLAERIAAANTVAIDDHGHLRIFNTDYAGALDALAQGMRCLRGDLRGRRAAILGSGGTARAIAAGLLDSGCHVVLCNRTLSRAEEMSRELCREPLTAHCSVCPWEHREQLGGADILINTTSVGMARQGDPNAASESPMPASALHGKLVVMDAVYTPPTTRLLQDAAAAGAIVIDGVSMFVNQAAQQFTAWTGAAAPKERFRDVLLDALGGSTP